jgi:RecG-like helicase
VRTWVKPESRRDEIYQLIREQLDAGRQAYVIYPLIEGSEKIDLKSATEMADHLQTEIFPAYRVALLHGRMKQDVKDRVMHAFAAGQIHILVSTTVVEVGVDVPNASIMVVEHAERFGLSQLHQLRGRVGRGEWESHCILLYQAPWTDDARERLKAMAATSDGFVIAERDLELRGARRLLRHATVRPPEAADRRPRARSRHHGGGASRSARTRRTRRLVWRSSAICPEAMAGAIRVDRSGLVHASHRGTLQKGDV